MKDLAMAARDQLKRAKALGASLDKRKADYETLHFEAPWAPNDEWRKDYERVNQSLQQAGTILIRALEENKKKLGGLTTEQLEAQFRSELIRSAKSLTQTEWEALVRTRTGLK